MFLITYLWRFWKDTASNISINCHFVKSALHTFVQCAALVETQMLPVVSYVLESLSFVQLYLLQDVDIRQSRQHGIRTTDPLRHVDKGTMESFASLINNHTTKYEVTLIAQPTGVTQQDQWDDFEIHCFKHLLHC